MRLHDFAAQPARKLDEVVSLDRGARIPPEIERLRGFLEGDPDLAHDDFGVLLDLGEAGVVEHLERRHLPFEIRVGDRLVGRSSSLPAGASAAAPTAATRAARWWCGVSHQRGPHVVRWFGVGVGVVVVARSNRRAWRGDRSPRPDVALRAVLCGNAMALTNSSWKRGSVAVSILSTSATTRSVSRRSAPDNSMRTAPTPAALPVEVTASTGQSGTRPSTIA